jgi:RND family efflux transporter MFP subunit
MTDTKNLTRYALALLVGSTLAVQVSAHGGEDHGDAPKSPAASAPVTAVNAQGQVTFNEPALRLPDGSVFVPKSAQRQLILRTRPAVKGEFPRTVELNGRIVADPNAGGRVQTFQSGRIEAGPNGLAVLGQRVSKGQILAWLQPAATALERGSQQSALAELAAQESVLERRLARLQQLDGSVPQKDIEQAEIELAAFKKRKSAVGGSLGREALVAPVSGVVSAANVAVGQVVDAQAVVFEVIDPQRLAVEALAYDPLLLDGLTKASAPIAGGVLDLTFVGLGRTLKEQAMPVLFRVAVPKDGALPAVAVGQTLKVLAQTKASQAGVAIPAAAVVRNAANESVVWVHESAERFVSRKVKVAALDGHSVAVTDGLTGGERVVVQGAASLAQIR